MRRGRDSVRIASRAAARGIGAKDARTGGESAPRVLLITNQTTRNASEESLSRCGGARKHAHAARAQVVRAHAQVCAAAVARVTLWCVIATAAQLARAPGACSELVVALSSRHVIPRAYRPRRRMQIDEDTSSLRDEDDDEKDEEQPKSRRTSASSKMTGSTKKSPAQVRAPCSRARALLAAPLPIPMRHLPPCAHLVACRMPRRKASTRPVGWAGALKCRRWPTKHINTALPQGLWSQ